MQPTPQAITDAVALFQSRAWLPLAILVIGFLNTALTSTTVPTSVSLSPLVRGVMIVVLSAVAGVLDSVAHGGAVWSAIGSGSVVMLISLWRDPDLIAVLKAKLPWFAKLVPGAVFLIALTFASSAGCAWLKTIDPSVITVTTAACTAVDFLDPAAEPVCLSIEALEQMLKQLLATPVGQAAQLSFLMPDNSIRKVTIQAEKVAAMTAKLAETHRAAMSAGMKLCRTLTTSHPAKRSGSWRSSTPCFRPIACRINRPSPRRCRTAARANARA